MKGRSPTTRSLRRSVVLPRDLIGEALRCRGGSPPVNVNRLIREALEEFVERRQRAEFAAEMARMARDPQIQAVSREITGDFALAEGDGLDAEEG